MIFYLNNKTKLKKLILTLHSIVQALIFSHRHIFLLKAFQIVVVVFEGLNKIILRGS